ncbi:MAG: hypothetical protein V3T86_13285 [Planctomycetota bacterium]
MFWRSFARQAVHAWIALVVLAADIHADEFATKATRTPADVRKFAGRMMGLAPNIRRTWIIPGLASSYVPQGIAVKGSVAVLSYYSKARGKPDASALVLVDLESGCVRTWARLRDANNKPVHDHVGGVAVIGDHLYTGARGRVRRFSLEALSETRRGRTLTELGHFEVDSRMSNISSEGDRLWIGEYRNTGYPTAGHHRNGSLRAWIAAYDVDRKSGDPIQKRTYRAEGREVLRPAVVLFAPNRIQGVAKHGDIFVLSISSGNTGTLRFFRSPLDGAPLRFDGPDRTPLRAYSLSKPYLTLAIPAGTEDLALAGESIYLTFESACRSYRHWRERGAVMEDRFYELAIPRPVEETHAPLLARTKFRIHSKKTRTLRFPFTVPGGDGAHAILKVGIADAEDNSGDRGLHMELVDNKGKAVHRTFVRGKELVWSDHDVTGGAWELRLIDRDTEFDSELPGNAGTVEIWIRK